MPQPSWRQLFECALFLEAKEGRDYPAFLPEHLLQRAEDAWQGCSMAGTVAEMEGVQVIGKGQGKRERKIIS